MTSSKNSLIETSKTATGSDYDFEPDPETILDSLLPRYVEARVYAALLNAAASEHAFRQRARLFVMYGQTEASARLSYVPPERLPEKLGSIGIGIPGIVDNEGGTVLWSPLLIDRDVRLRDDFGRAAGVPVEVDNDANLGAIAERWWGAGVGVDDFIYLKVATGIGAGHVVDGQVYRGASGLAGEIGHVVIDPDGAPCVCGRRGCLVTFVGRQALEARAAG